MDLSIPLSMHPVNPVLPDLLLKKTKLSVRVLGEEVSLPVLSSLAVVAVEEEMYYLYLSANF